MAALSYVNCSMVFGVREILNLLPTIDFSELQNRHSNNTYGVDKIIESKKMIYGA